jgi:hypothetical protein
MKEKEVLGRRWSRPGLSKRITKEEIIGAIRDRERAEKQAVPFFLSLT